MKFAVGLEEHRLSANALRSAFFCWTAGELPSFEHSSSTSSDLKIAPFALLVA